LLEQGGGEVLDIDLLVRQADGLRVRGAKRFLELFGEAVGVHDSYLQRS
jgi:hypothetical protein